MRLCPQNRAVRYGLSGALVLFLLVFLIALSDVVYHHYDLKSGVDVYLRRARLKSDLEVRRDIFNLVQSKGIECSEDHIEVSRSHTRVKVNLTYRYPLGLPHPKGRFIMHSMAVSATVERNLPS